MPKTPLLRLIQAVKEFNIGQETVLQFLAEKKFNVTNLSMNSRLSSEMYDALEKEFKEDKIVKEKSEKASTQTKELTNIIEAKKQKFKTKQELKKSDEEVADDTFIKIKVPETKKMRVFHSIDLSKTVKKPVEAHKTKISEGVQKEIPKAKKEEPLTIIQKKTALSNANADTTEEKVKRTADIKFDPLSVIKKINIGDIEKKENQVKESRRKHIVPVRPKDRSKDSSYTRRESSTKYVPRLDKEDIKDRVRLTQNKISSGNRGQIYRTNRKHKSKYRKQQNAEIRQQKQDQINIDNSTLQVTEFISVADLASLMNVPSTVVISKCMELDIMVSINQRLDAEVIELVATELGFEIEFLSENIVEEIIDEIEEDPASLVTRPPIVTIMGHVDHGKTSLLDFIRESNIIAGESGGITQHIGAYEVTLDNGKQITFLDTPGHEAFTAMRARGTKATDIVVIVIAADDTVMPQTKEAISHAKAANAPMIFAINKIDKEGAQPEKIKEQLSQMDVLVEDWGGKYQCEHISAKKGTGVDKLLEKILVEAELMDLKANPNKNARGIVLEASLEKGRGYVTNILVMEGTLTSGNFVVAGPYFGRIKAMFNERDKKVLKASLSTPVSILGMNGAAQAGEPFYVFDSESQAKELANKRMQILREQSIKTKKHITLDEIGRRLSLGNFKQLNLIIKADFDGSAEALADSLQKLSTEQVSVLIVHKAVGQISESDVLLATASESIIIGFQVRPSQQARQLAEAEQIEIKTYSIIYEVIEDVKAAMEGLLSPVIEEKITGKAEIREIFKINNNIVAGCMVTYGKIVRNSLVKIIREGIVIYSGTENNPALIDTLKRFKEDVKEVTNGMECGLTLKSYHDLKVGDEVEVYEIEKIKQKL